MYAYVCSECVCDRNMCTYVSDSSMFVCSYVCTTLIVTLTHQSANERVGNLVAVTICASLFSHVVGCQTTTMLNRH